MPFVGELLEVHDDHVILHHYGEPEDQVRRMRGTREDRPAVMDPELERSSLTVRLSEESCPIKELKLRKHLNQSVAEMG